MTNIVLRCPRCPFTVAIDDEDNYEYALQRLADHKDRVHRPDPDPDLRADGGPPSLSDNARQLAAEGYQIRLHWHSDDVHIHTDPMPPAKARELQRLLQTATVTLEDGNQRPLVDGHVVEPELVEGDE